MNKSIKTLLAISVLVGGALAINPRDTVQASNTVQLVGPAASDEADELNEADRSAELVMPFELKEHPCLYLVRKELESVKLPDDIAEMMAQLSSESQGESLRHLIDSGLQNQANPESCPGFVVDIDSIKKKHCGFLEKHPDFSGNIDEELINDDGNASWILLAARACVRLANLEFQTRRDELMKTFEQLTVPEDVKNLMERKKRMKDWSEKEEDRLVAESCSEFIAQVDSFGEAVNELSSRGSSFGKIEVDKDKYILFADVYDFCSDILEYTQRRQTVTGESSQSSHLNDD